MAGCLIVFLGGTVTIIAVYAKGGAPLVALVTQPSHHTLTQLYGGEHAKLGWPAVVGMHHLGGHLLPQLLKELAVHVRIGRQLGAQQPVMVGTKEGGSLRWRLAVCSALVDSRAQLLHIGIVEWYELLVALVTLLHQLLLLLLHPVVVLRVEAVHLYRVVGHQRQLLLLDLIHALLEVVQLVGRFGIQLLLQSS